jgi:2-polyprenyl-3-methyl-5-hydroxy-6-metoxy-1,4-benzoquinol methylase
LSKPRGYQADFYQQHPSIHDLERRRRKAAKIQALLSAQVGFPFEEAVCLDIGCSSGVQTCELASMFSNIFGIDYDAIILHAGSRPSDCRAAFLRGDAMHLPFASASLDVILCAQVYEHVPDDERLASEMLRVLKPGGIVFFSGPNRLFPIEPHYYLPFLHWLPENLADAYLRLFRKGTHFYERSRTLWGLRRLFAAFTIQDMTLQALQLSDTVSSPFWQARLLRIIPRRVWKWLLPLFPNYNWILRKT